MTDLPTRSKALIRGSKPHGLSCDDWVAGPVLRMYGNGDLLTREEAAVDPEVIEAVMRGAIYWPATQWTWLSMRPSQDDVSGITWEVGDE